MGIKQYANRPNIVENCQKRKPYCLRFSVCYDPYDPTTLSPRNEKRHPLLGVARTGSPRKFSNPKTRLP